MRKITKTLKKWSLSLFILVAVCPRVVFAAASISISGGAWALGTQRAQIESTSPANNWTVTNDSGGTENVSINVSSTGTWTASTDGTQSAIDKFVLKKDSSAGTIITATDQTLVSNLANAGTSSFGLYFETPISGSEQGAHTLTITLTAVAVVPTYAVLTSGTSWTVPAGVTSVKFWAIGAGGGGAGAIANDGTSGGAGGAGGVCYKTYTVSPGGTVTYSLGGVGSAGSGSNNGTAGSATTVTAGGVTITANGGAGGRYQNSGTNAGGTYSGGDGGANGGTGSGATGDQGGGGGGGIGGGNGATVSGGTGANGGQSIDVSGLFSALSSLSYATTSYGAGSGNVGSNISNGGAATGFGCGGGGANFWGGNGGNGLYGGGGGGASGFSATQTGGTGGAGVVVLSY